MLEEAPPHIVGDLHRDVTGSALTVDSHDADGVVFASEQLADQGPTSVVVVGLARGPGRGGRNLQGQDRCRARDRGGRLKGYS